MRGDASSSNALSKLCEACEGYIIGSKLTHMSVRGAEEPLI